MPCCPGGQTPHWNACPGCQVLNSAIESCTALRRSLDAGHSATRPLGHSAPGPGFRLRVSGSDTSELDIIYIIGVTDEARRVVRPLHPLLPHRFHHEARKFPCCFVDVLECLLVCLRAARAGEIRVDVFDG